KVVVDIWNYWSKKETSPTRTTEKTTQYSI
ncbi:MAG: hypothetical protein ACJAZS_000150, partial [Alteromonas naphthalenivorans]